MASGHSTAQDNSIIEMPVTLLADPQDTVQSFVTDSFNRLIKSVDWKHARKTFCGALLSGHDIGSARLHTLAVHGLA